MVKVLIMSGYGINCENESAHAFEVAGAKTEIVHINDLINRKKDMNDFDIMMFPGGFSYGDDTGSGNAFANKMKNNLWKELQEFINQKKLIIGVCNGFQILSNLGLFTTKENSYGKKTNALLWNTKNRYQDRWVHLKHQDSKCIFTKGIEITHIPIAHGEGRFYCDKETLEQLKENKQIVFRYSYEDGREANGQEPFNPNGAIYDIAGVCDYSGRILGMMPHPERGLYSTSEPEYHKKKESGKRNGEKLGKFLEPNLQIFKNAVNFIKEQKGE
jgi:phosphoribosylformylglycinamidine synthase I